MGYDLEKLDILCKRRIGEIRNSGGNIKNTTGKTYYVSECGNDANDGLSEKTPVRSLKCVSGLALEAGDTVLFRKNETFRGMLVCHEGVTYSSYGCGEKPILTASVENAARHECWKKLPGTNDIFVYCKDIPDCGTVYYGDGDFCAIKEIPDCRNGEYYVRGTDKKFDVERDIKNDLGIFCDCRKKTKTFDNGMTVPEMYNSENIGKLYVKSVGGKNPAERFSKIELNIRHNVICGRNNVTIDGLCVEYCGCHGIGCGSVNGLVVRNCEIRHIGGGIQFYNNEGRVTRYGNGVEIYGGCLDYTVENCYVHDIYDAAVTHQFNGECTMENVRYSDNVIENSVYSIEYFLSPKKEGENIMKNILIENNIMRYAGYGLGMQRPDKETPSHIKSWDTVNNSEDFVIKNNIFDRSNHMIIHISAKDGKHLPTLENNVYIQYEGNEFARYGAFPTTLIYADEKEAAKLIKNIDRGEKAELVIIKTDKEEA